jgi:hypothetical protein
MFDRFISWVYTRRIFGPRCADYEQGCPVCDAWNFHDDLFGE